MDPAQPTQVDRELAGALAEVGRAGDPDVLERSVLAAAAVASAAGERIQGAPVDSAVARANAALANGLRQFGRDMAFLSQREICAGPAAVGAIGTAPSMPALRAVAAGLALPGDDGLTYRWGSSLPVEPEPSEVVWTTDCRTPRCWSTGGRGNRWCAGDPQRRDRGRRCRALRSRAAQVSVAVSVGQGVRVAGIADGDYDLAYTAGWDWDAGLSAFSRRCQFRRGAPVSFSTTAVPAGTVRTVVVRPGPPDATTLDITPRELAR